MLSVTHSLPVPLFAIHSLTRHDYWPPVGPPIGALLPPIVSKPSHQSAKLSVTNTSPIDPKN
ncbi:unnamed protein product [Oppiella nova]|uniref:Uncharacterized protein n=1 Tax=Oppiella nova TaxID=334625 RepID=A0A7R9M4B2_9ACAR|nr:unnamed protein product [Oppiella nova]CAG2170524.1 unnamed protein product [Oppiella nova]